MPRPFRWILYLLGSLIGLVVIAAGLVYGLSEFRLRETYDFPIVAAQAASDEVNIARGEHLARAVLICTECHGHDFAGKAMIEDPMLAHIYTANLTPGRGGLDESYTDEDLIRAIRYGVKPDGGVILFMGFPHLSEEDTLAVVSFVRSLEPIDKVKPSSSFGPVGRFGFVVGMFGDLIHAESADPSAPWPEPVEPAVNLEYGRYLTDNARCNICHGANFEGGKLEGGPEDPPAADLSANGYTANWTLEEFIQTIRTGQNPVGHRTDPFMPSEYYANMTDEELEAIWIFIRSETGQN